MREFLLTAKVIRHKDPPKGSTHPAQLTLSNGTLTHDAIVSYVQETLPIMKFANGRTELNFVDSYAYNIAAYRVAELLGLDDMMPVTVEAKWDGRKGSLAWMIDTMMDEEARRAKKMEPPDRDEWNHQMHRMRVFAQLVADTDRNLGNVLIDHEWKLWMIDPSVPAHARIARAGGSRAVRPPPAGAPSRADGAVRRSEDETVHRPRRDRAADGEA
jgi:hypothetical protein